MEETRRWFWKACDKYGFPFGSLFKLLLISAQRRLEVGEMTYGELSLVDKIWRIPARRTKNGQEHAVPLSTAALAIISSLPQIVGEQDHVFTTTGRAPVSGYSKAKAKIDLEMLRLAREEAEERGDDIEGVKIARWTLHDLRRTAASEMAGLRVDLPTILVR